ncbi:MAG: ABC transporter permease [Oscillospiraceae bacterium]|nr:ABC transporter permease [Oscillospiraceae bacterium]
MKQVFQVASFTFREAVRKKAFIISNIIIVVLVALASFFLPRLGNDTQSLGENILGRGEGYECYWIDESGGLLEGSAELLETFMGITVVPQKADQLEDALDLVREDGSRAALTIGPGDPPQITLYTKDFMSPFPISSLAEALNTAYRLNRFEALGYPPAEAREVLLSVLPVEAKTVGEQSMGNWMTGIILMMAMFFMIYYYGYAVAMSVAMEKSSRVMETLIVSAKPPRILLGKCLGAGLLGLAQMTGLLAFAALCKAMLSPDSGEGAALLDLPELSIGRALLILVYFVLGYILFAMVNSVCGAMVSKMEDLQAAMMPSSLIAVASFYGGYLTNLLPGAGENTISTTALIPFTAPFAVPFQLLNKSLPAGLLAASIGSMLVAIAIVSFLSMRIYSASVLHYGGRLRWNDLVKMAKTK